MSMNVTRSIGVSLNQFLFGTLAKARAYKRNLWCIGLLFQIHYLPWLRFTCFFFPISFNQTLK